MKLSRTAIEIYRRDARMTAPAGMRVAVSLHSHSNCSREKLDFVPGMVRRIPFVAALYERSMADYRRDYGAPLDFAMAYWRPPLSAEAVIASEVEQIERRLDCAALVSLTDHDTIEGPLALRAAGRYDVPLSVEWTVPFREAVFHLGVHGLPPSRVEDTQRALAAYTAGGPVPLGDLLDFVCECPETLVVLNHPCWDLAGLGMLQHESRLLAFLQEHRDRIHALELNGYRTWAENRRVLPLAEAFHLPVVGGGDRHGYPPNTIINLTAATCLGEFAHELRSGRGTHCVIFPEYLQPHAARMLETAVGVLRHIPDHHGGDCSWSERVFITTAHGVVMSAESMWNGAPWWLTGVVGITRLLGSGAVRPLFELIRTDGHRTIETDCHPEPAIAVVHALEAPRSAAVV